MCAWICVCVCVRVFLLSFCFNESKNKKSHTLNESELKKLKIQRQKKQHRPTTPNDGINAKIVVKRTNWMWIILCSCESNRNFDLKKDPRIEQQQQKRPENLTTLVEKEVKKIASPLRQNIFIHMYSLNANPDQN